MSDLETLRRVAIVGAVLAVLVSVPATVLFFAAYGWNIEAAVFGDPKAILGRGASAAALLRWGAIGDMFYSYLLLVPLALFLHRRLRENRPWLADLGIVAGLAYIFFGAAGAAILAVAGSSLVDAYSIAAPADRFAIATSFELVSNIVFFALWQLLDAITLGTWILTTGILMLSERPAVARLLIVLGIAVIAASGMTMLGIHSLAILVGGVVAALAVWAAWMLTRRNRNGR